MNRYIYYASIFANLVFVAFLGCLIYSTARTMRAVQHLNPLWFVLIAIAVIVLAAVVNLLRSRRAKPKSTEARSQTVKPDPAKDLAVQAAGGQPPSATQTVPDAPG